MAPNSCSVSTATIRAQSLAVLPTGAVTLTPALNNFHTLIHDAREAKLFGAFQPACSVTGLSSFCCACCQYGRTVEKMGPQAFCGGNCCDAGWFYCLMCSVGLTCVPQLITRGDIRKTHGMQPGSAGDCMIAWCCPICSLCQEAREVEIRRGNAVKHGHGGPVYISDSCPQTQTMT